MNKNKPILFCDFDGTLCHDRYWRSLPPNKHEKLQELFFGNDTTFINDWMRGKYSAEEINQSISQRIEMPFESLWDIFVSDCKTMRVPKEALEMLNSLRDRYIVILITGNMDSFTRFTQSALGLENYFDCISNSFYEGVHKTDNEGEIFIKYTNKYKVSIQTCILIDDSKKVCKIFNKLGGTAYRVIKNRDIIYYLEKLTDRDALVGKTENHPNFP